MSGRGLAHVIAATGAPRRARPRRSLDWALVIGGLAVATMVGLALYGPIIAPHDPFDTNFLYQGKLPPYDPSPTFPLGTDAAGRDRLSLLLWGARNTFSIAFVAAALRLGIGAFLGVFAGWQGGTKELRLSRLALGLSSVPATIAALMAVIAFNVYAGALAFILALGLVGWGDAFHQARRATRAEAARPFIETARTLGMSEERVVLRHLLPNLAPALLTVGALQVSAVLLLMGELALLRIFLGGAITVDLFTQPLRLPVDPEWASLLGTTRPIFDLYGNTIAVLAPAGALLAAVVSINLFADALARRAQRLDVFRLFSPRQSVMLGLAAVVIVGPALLWPSRLAPQLDYGRQFNAGGAAALAQELMDPRFAGRTAESTGAAASAELIRDRIGGRLVDIHEQVVQVAAGRLERDGRSVSLGDELGVLTPYDATVTADLVFVDFVSSIGGNSFGRSVTGRIAVVSTSVESSVSFWEGAISRAGGVGLIVLTDDPAGLYPSADFPLPTIRTTPAAFTTVLGQPFPVPARGSSATPLDVTVSLSVSAPPVSVGGVNVVALVPGRTVGGMLIVVAAPYDTSPSIHYLDYPSGGDEASATAALVGAAQQLRGAPLNADVVFVSVGSMASDSAGLKSALRSLTPDQARRLTALIWLPSALGRQVFIRSDPADAKDPIGSFRVAGRVATAVGARSGAQFSPALPRALAATDLRAPTFEVTSFAVADTLPSTETLTLSGRALLTLLAYVADQPEALK